MSDITIRPPGSDAPGFLRRMQRAWALRERFNQNDPKAIDELVAFLIDTCEIEVPDGVKPADALMDLSARDFAELLDTFTAATSSVNPPSDD